MIDIDKYLQKEYEFHVNNHGKNQIFGTFLIGLGNYGFAEKLSDLSFITIYIPTFDYLCTGEIEHNGTASMLGKLIDIRVVYNMATHRDLSMLELLFTNRYIINPKYQNIFTKDFYNNRNEIASYNRKERIKKARRKADAAYREGNFFECERLLIAAKLYSKGFSCDECFHITDNIYKDYLWKCKRNEIDIDINEILTEFNKLEDLEKDEISFIADAALKKGVVDTITQALQETVPLDAFENCLTITELKAWKFIKNKLVNGSTFISITKIIQDTDISRPVWKNLFLKLEQNKIAKINNKGVKGTQIVLLENK